MDKKPSLKPRSGGDLKSALHARAAKTKKPSTLSVLKALLAKKLADRKIKSATEPDQNQYSPEHFNSEDAMIDEPIIVADSSEQQQDQEQAPQLKASRTFESAFKRPKKEKVKGDQSKPKASSGLFGLGKRIKQKTNTKNVLQGQHNPAYLVYKDILSVLGPSTTVVPEKPSLLVASIEGRDVFWQINDKGAKIVSEVPAGRTTLSFTSLDYRVVASKPLTKKAAQLEMTREAAVKAHVVNKSGELYAVYGTPVERSEALKDKMRLVPGASVLDRLIRRHAHSLDLPEDFSLIFGLSIPSQDDPTKVALLILAVRDPSGGISEPQVSVNPDNVEFIVGQFTSNKRIQRAKAKVSIFEYDKYVDIAEDFDKYAYPAEPEFHGIKLKQVLAAGLIGSTLLAGYSLTNMAYFTLTNQSAKSKGDALKKQVAAAEMQLRTYTSSKVRPLAIKLNESMSLGFILESADKVHIPDSVMSAQALGETVRFTMKVPILNKTNRVIPQEILSAEKMAEVLRYEAPEGCNREKVTFNGNLNDIIVEVTCSGPNSGIHSFRNR